MNQVPATFDIYGRDDTSFDNTQRVTISASRLTLELTGKMRQQLLRRMWV